MKHLTIALITLFISMGAWAEDIETFNCTYKDVSPETLEKYKGDELTSVYIIDFDQGIALKKWKVGWSGDILDEETNKKFTLSPDEITFKTKVMTINGGCVITERIFREDLSYKQKWACKYEGLDAFDLDWSGQCKITESSSL
tara:strand:- start:99 stop:527 length:429 start_codon:yes stop_codon:yes gene_type:complete